MRVMLVDDEPLILDRFEKLITENKGIELIGKFSNPHQALEAILKDRPDAVFLDVEMPELNGIELAEKIQNSLLQTKIVFVTAYSEYAVEAFELNAIDYLVKPVQRARLTETIHRLSKEFNLPSISTEPIHDTMVCCFQSLQFKRSGDYSQTLEVRWRTTKAKELFAFLVQHRQNPVRKDVILDLLWPDTDRDKGVTQLYSTIYQIRKTLESIGCNIAITSHENSYMLDLNGTKLDVDEWEQSVSELSSVSDDTLHKHRELIEQYHGDYLIEHDYLWAESERERLRALWLHHVTKVTDFLFDTGEYTEAIALYHLVQERYPFMEDSYFMLMQLYDKLGDRYAVEQQYVHLTDILTNEFDVDPPPAIKTWYQIWKKR